MATNVKVVQDYLQPDGKRRVVVEDPAIPGMGYGVVIAPGDDLVKALSALIAKRKAAGIDYPGKPAPVGTVISLP